MANSKFDSKSFNAEAFAYMVDRVPNLNMSELKKSRALTGNPDVRGVFTSQNGQCYARLAMRGLIGGDAVNYDGQTDITADSTKTMEQGMVVVGRAKAWKEKDFSADAAGVDFMDNIARQIAEYRDALDQDTILAILKGVFSRTGTNHAEFVTEHTTALQGGVEASTLNTAVTRACGANRKKFTLVFMHSAVAASLENMNLIERLRYTDAEGVSRDLELGTWNGRLVVVDDGMPAEAGYFDAQSDTPGAVKLVADSASPADGEMKAGEASPYFGSGSPAAGGYVVKDFRYTTYILGDGAIVYEDIGARVPYEIARDPKTAGGEDTLYMRQRKVFAPFGISYEKASQASLSPTDAELSSGANWTLCHSGEESESDRTYISHKAIPIARVLSRA